MKKYAFRKIFAIVLTTALVFAFTVPVSATGSSEEFYTPTEVTAHEKAPDVHESEAEPTGEQLALIKDISVPEPTESVSETETPVIPSEEAAYEESLEEVAPEETITEETVAEEPQEAPVDTVSEQEEIVYNTSALTLDNLPEYIVNNTIEKDVVAVGIAEEDMTELSSFTTINEDETRTLYLFGDPVKYIDKTDNSIRFIDNSIVPLTSENGGLLTHTVTGYKNGGNSYDLFMPNRINMGVRFTSDDISVLMTPAVSSSAQGILKTHSFLGITEQVVEYRNVFGSGIHLQYTPVNSGVKENIILDSYSGVNTFNFTISTGDYYPLYTEGEAIPFIDPTTDDTAFILGQVDARDSYTGEETDGHFTLYNSLTLTEIRPGLYTLTVTVDKEFLTDPDTVYPVVVDPTLTISATYIYDTTVYSGNPDKQAYYSSAYIVAGYHGTSGKEATAYVRCTSKILDCIYVRPNNISSAKYKIYEGSGKTNSMTVQLRGALSNWNQNSITYNNQPSLDSVTSSVTISKSGWYEFAATNLVKKWLKDARGESGGISFMSGFALKASTTGVSSKHFCSANYSGSLTPSLIITYNDYVIHNIGTILPYEGSSDVSNKDAVYNTKWGYAWGKLITCDQYLYSFSVPETATYQINTLTSPGVSSNASGTYIDLYNSSYERLSRSSTYTPSDPAVSPTYYWYYLAGIEVSLSPGTYYVDVTDVDPNAFLNDCYLIIDCNDFLDNDPQSCDEQYMSETIREFYAIGPKDWNDNCFSYATGAYSQDFPRTISGIRLLFTDTNGDYKYTETQHMYTNNCVIVYAFGSNSVVCHFSRTDNNIITSKLSGNFLVRQTSVDAYFENSFGEPVLYFTK